MKKLIIITALVFVFGCSSSDEKPSVVPKENESLPSKGSEKTGETESAVLKMINVSLYSTKHPEKAQPMLIKVVSQPDEIKLYNKILKKNGTTEIALTNISEVYYLQFEYVKSGVSEYKDIFYVKGSENNAFYKEFKMKPEFNFDKFDQQTREIFIQSIGNKDWYVVIDQLPI
ncbi:hypothetical protein ACFQ88_22505 [Paenibacillus sp. NPDC056579]|uniref:hypothetical protein n=1 Tax=Paenibacillus sp. NPDC056579 TaxID=3345871 RepID=UPI0036BA8307